MAAKKQKAGSTSRMAVARAFYDPAIREVIAAGDLAKMKKVLVQARAILKEQGNLPAAIKRLEKAITKREQQ